LAKPSFLLQGIRRSNDHETALRQLFNIDELSRVILSVAFVREAGVSQIGNVLRENSRKIVVIAGIRNGSTSAQGLLALLDCKVKLLLVDTGASTPIFHPKVYLAVANNTACAIVGSANLTSSGLNLNIEASTVLSLDRTDDSDESFLQDLLSAINALQQNYPEHVFPVTRKREIADLLRQGRLEDERYSIPPQSNRLRKNTERDKLKRMKLFSKPRPIQTRRIGREKRTVLTKTKPPHTLELVWISKGLTERDLNIPSGRNTNPTGSMLLKKGQMDDIDLQSYFRDDAFSSLNWRNDPQPRLSHLERTQAEFEIIIKGISYGIFSLQLTHNSRTNTRAYEQRNAMTQIHWGKAKGIVAQRDLLQRELRLYRKIDKADSFLIEID